MNATVRVLAADDAAGLAAAYALRAEVFVAEQGVPAEVERDLLDSVAVHLLATRDGEAVGAARLLPPQEGTAVLGRVAVRAGLRGGGVGAVLVAVAEEQAARLGAAVVELHAQVPVRGFYERLGYLAVGAEYDEAGIRHVTMRRRLRPG